VKNIKKLSTEKNENRIQKGFRYLKVAAFIAIIAGIPIMLFVRYPDFGSILTDRDALGAFLAENESENVLIYYIIQIVTVVIGLPIGQVINFAGVLVFGAPLAFLLSITGTAIGTFIAFNIARYLGKEFVTLIFKEKNVTKFTTMMDTSKAYIVIVLVYLIPGFPKDIFTYVAGLSTLRALPFTLTAVVARIPAMLGTMFFGHFVREGDFVGAAVVAAIVAALLIIIVVKRKKVFAYIESLHERVKK